MAELRRVNMGQYQLLPERYRLESGDTEGAPLCPYGNHFEWVGYDIEREEYVRFTKSVFKILVEFRRYAINY